MVSIIATAFQGEKTTMFLYRQSLIQNIDNVIHGRKKETPADIIKVS